MSYKVLMLMPNLKSGSPAFERFYGYKKYYESDGAEVCVSSLEDRWLPFKVLSYICSSDNFFIFMTMPPFAWWIFFLFPFAKIVLDIRDGWSISMNSGYGGTSSKSPIKALIATKIEKLAIKISYLTVTCTPGLRDYLENTSKSKIELITNGITNERIELAKKAKSNIQKRNDSRLVFVCAGQFSEYGIGKVKILLKAIIRRYSDCLIEIILIGSDESKNNWLTDYFFALSHGRGKVKILPRMNISEMYHVMAQADFGMVIIRDPSYDFGTKIYDYIALGLPVVNYFESPNSFTNYFDSCLDFPFGKNRNIPEISREILLANKLKFYFK